MAKKSPLKKVKLLKIHVKYKLYLILRAWIKTQQKQERMRLSKCSCLNVSHKHFFKKQNQITFTKAQENYSKTWKLPPGSVHWATLLHKSSEVVMWTLREFQTFNLGKVGFSCCSSDLIYIWRTLLQNPSSDTSLIKKETHRLRSQSSLHNWRFL